MNTQWHDILGNVPANEALHAYQATPTGIDETLAAWMERQSIELWAATGEHRDADWAALATQLVADIARRYGTVEHGGREYTLTGQAEYSNRVFPGGWGDASEGDAYTTEFNCPAIDREGNPYQVYWQFDAVKGQEPSDDSNLPWGDEHITRVIPQ